MDTTRFAPGKGVVTLLCNVHADHFLRASDKKRLMLFAKPEKHLNLVGYELWVIVGVSGKEDPVHPIALEALTKGDPIAYLALLDKLEEDSILTEEEVAKARVAAGLWQQGYTGRQLENEMIRLYGPTERPANPDPPSKSAYPEPNSALYIPGFKPQDDNSATVAE